MQGALILGEIVCSGIIITDRLNCLSELIHTRIRGHHLASFPPLSAHNFNVCPLNPLNGGGRLYLVHVELPRQKLRSMSCTGSQFASCVNGVISLRVVSLARLYVRPAKPGDPAAPYGASEQLLLF